MRLITVLPVYILNSADIVQLSELLGLVIEGLKQFFEMLQVLKLEGFCLIHDNMLDTRQEVVVNKFLLVYFLAFVVDLVSAKHPDGKRRCDNDV